MPLSCCADLLTAAVRCCLQCVSLRATIRYASSAPSSAFASSSLSSFSAADSDSPSSSQPLLSRESFELQQMVNLSWLCIGLSLPLAVLLAVWFIRYAPSEALPLGYVQCVLLYALASVVELLCEPLFVIAARRLLVGCRVWIDSAATLLRCIVTVLAIAVWDAGLLSFAYGQLAFAAFYSAAFYAYFVYHISTGKHAIVGVTALTQLLPTPIPAPQRRAINKQQPLSATTASSPVTRQPVLSLLLLEAWLDSDLLTLYSWLLVQMLEKLALTEGEKAVMVSFQFSLDQQGVYGLVQNLGSLVARLLFAPLEEASATEFSLLFASAAGEQLNNQRTSSASSAAEAVESDSLLSPTRHSTVIRTARSPASSSSALTQPSKSSSPIASASSSALLSVYSSAVLYLGTLLKLLTVISLVLLTFGPPFSFVFIDVLYGAKWSRTDAPSVLSAFCVYIAFMALNGLSEAFVTAVTTAAQMKLYNLLLLVFSAVYLTACALLLKYGALGLIAANCLNMTLRIAYSFAYSHRFFKQARGVDPQVSARFPARILSSATPSLAVLGAFAVSAAVCHLSQRWLSVSAAEAGLSTSAAPPTPVSSPWLLYVPHVSVGVACASSVVWLLWRDERPFLTQLYALTVSRAKQGKAVATAHDANNNGKGM